MYKKRGRKGQITAFMVVGILLVLFASIYFYVQFSKIKDTTQKEVEEALQPGELPALKTYVKRCIVQTTKPLAEKMALQGGTLNPIDFAYYNKDKLNYLCIKESATKKCTNSLLTKQQMVFELENEIKNNIKDCIDLDIYRKKGYEITEKELNVKVEITQRTVDVELNYPITLSQEGKETEISLFSEKVPSPLGQAYELAESIVNKEIEQGYFDIDDWMINNNLYFEIEKHRPYPDIIYMIKDNDFKFQFAIQGSPTVGQYIDEKRDFGTCVNNLDQVCFANVPEVQCNDINGLYITDKTYSCPGKNIPSPEEQFKNCGTKQHGESWCEYDSITGNGYDFVGSRHYKVSCIDGKEVTEECRDYREELCTETTGKAVCRDNRWQDCYECDTKTCCENTDLRDCHWNDWLETENKCTPEVPPGLRFWLKEGSDICLNANSQKDCEGISCPNAWLDSAAILCYKQGDCGNYRNIADTLTLKGFFESDPLDRPRDYIYLKDNLNTNKRKWFLQLPIDKMQQKAVTRKALTPAPNIPNFISTVMNMLDDIFSIEPSDFIKPFTDDPVVEVTAFTHCDLWSTSIKENECELCNEGVCSEYKCKSLGGKCQFSYEEGVPKCFEQKITDVIPPKIIVDRDVLDSKYQLRAVSLLDMRGYEITPKVIPHKPLTLAVNTDEPTRCKIDYAPTLMFTSNKRDYYSLPSIWFGDGTFKTHHEMKFRTPPRVDIPKKILDFLNFTSTDDFSGAVDNLDKLYNNYKEDYKSKIKLYQTFSGKDILEKTNPIVENIKRVIDLMVPRISIITKELINQYTKGGYYLFIKCVDRAGNENIEQFYYKFEIDENYEDNDAPEILETVPENNIEAREKLELKIYLDEPSECRYDYSNKLFENMNNSFECVDSEYMLSPQAGGSYECKDEVKVNNKTEETKIYIRCKDHPLRTKGYRLKLNLEDNFGIEGLDKFEDESYNITDYIQLTSPNKIDVTADLLPQINFNVKGDIDLWMYIDDFSECRYSNKSYEQFTEMKNKFEMCERTNKLEMGMYKCNAKISPQATLQSLGEYELEVVKADKTEQHPVVNVSEGEITMEFNNRLEGSASVKINFTEVNLKLEIKAKTQCKYDNTPMSCITYENKTTCNKQVTVEETKTFNFECIETSTEKNKIDYYIKCLDKKISKRNTNMKSQIFTIKKGEELKFTTIKPQGQVGKDTLLIANLNKDIDEYEIQCVYANARNPTERFEMEKIDSRFEIELNNLEETRHVFYIICTDKFENKVTGTAKFQVIE